MRGKKLETQIGGEYLLWSNFTHFFGEMKLNQPAPQVTQWQLRNPANTGALDQGTPLKRKPSCRESPDPELWANPGPHEVLNSLFSFSFQMALPTRQHGHQAKELPRIRKANFKFQAWVSGPQKGSYTGEVEGRNVHLYSIHLICELITISKYCFWSTNIYTGENSRWNNRLLSPLVGVSEQHLGDHLKGILENMVWIYPVQACNPGYLCLFTFKYKFIGNK